MYKKRVNGWIKHLDFILLDLLCIQIAFCISYICRFGWENPYKNSIYASLALAFLVCDLLASIVTDSFKNVLKRGYYIEFKCVLKHVITVEALALFYLFTVKRSVSYSRISFFVMIPFYIVIDYFVRCLWKRLLMRFHANGAMRSVLIIAPGRKLESSVCAVLGDGYTFYRCIGLVANDDSIAYRRVGGIPVVCKYNDVIDYVCHKWVDEIFIFVDEAKDYPRDLIESIAQMGITSHVAIAKAINTDDPKQFTEQIGDTIYMTKTMNFLSARQAILKRTIDIAGGLAGCLLMLLILVVCGPLIYIASPGPIFFTQERIGRNGKRFKMYKFRSMYLDAEERKKELLAQNKIGDGMMFKLDFDPRIIGNRTLPDGTKKTGIGQFMRHFSLDEFPQFINVLKGDMSLVGTRPPTVDEWVKYESTHRARMAFRPGITGLWQVSGRSNITDFEKVVKLDTEYIDNWSIKQDVIILFKTVKVMLLREGAV